MLYFKPDDPAYLERFQFAENLLKWYVDAAPGIFGGPFVTYNVHNLIHLHQDVVSHNCGLEMVSAFPFENFLNRVKRMVRKAHQPIAQVAKRMKEVEVSEYYVSSKSLKTKFAAVKNNIFKNSWFLLKNEKICKIVEMRNGTKEMKVHLYSFQRSLSYFESPIDSKLLHICFLPKGSDFRSTDIVQSDILKKFVPIPEEDGLLLVPMLHDLKV